MVQIFPKRGLGKILDEITYNQLFLEVSFRLNPKIVHANIKIPVHNHIVIPFHSPFNKVMFVNIHNCIKQIEINKTKECFIEMPPN